MTFRDLFNKYKVLVFICYALAVSIAITFITVWWINLILILPLIALGVVILIGIFPRRERAYLTIVCADGMGTVQITSVAIVKALRDATNAIDGVRYQASAVTNDKAGLNVRIEIKIINSKVLEISEVTRVFVKKLLEKEMNVRVAKIDIIVKNFVYNVKVNKVDPSDDSVAPAEPAPSQSLAPHYAPDAPSYKLKYGEQETTFVVPSDNVLRTREIKEPVRRVTTIERVPEQVIAPVKSIEEERIAAAQARIVAARERAAVSAEKYAPASIQQQPAPIAEPPQAQRASAASSETVTAVTEKHTVVETVSGETPPAFDDPHKDVGEVPIPAPKTRAEQLQEQREAAARKFAELKAKQEQRRREAEVKQ